MEESRGGKEGEEYPEFHLDMCSVEFSVDTQVGLDLYQTPILHTICQHCLIWK